MGPLPRLGTPRLGGTGAPGTRGVAVAGGAAGVAGGVGASGALGGPAAGARRAGGAGGRGGGRSRRGSFAGCRWRRSGGRRLGRLLAGGGSRSRIEGADLRGRSVERHGSLRRGSRCRGGGAFLHELHDEVADLGLEGAE